MLGLGELPVSRIVKDLLDLGVVELNEVGGRATAPGYPAEPGYQAPYGEPEYEQADYRGESYGAGYESAAAYEAPSYEPAGYEQPAYPAGEYDDRYENDPRYATAAYDTPAGHEAADEYGGYDEAPGGDADVIEFSPYGESGGYDGGSYEGNGSYESNGGGYGNGYGNGSGYESYYSGSLVMDDSHGSSYEDRFASNPPPPAARAASYDTDPTDAA